MRTESLRQGNRRRSLRRSIVLCFFTLTGCSAPDDVLFENARVRALITGQDKTVAYMDITNQTSRTMTLVGASSESVRTIEIHTTRMDDGVMRMRRLKSVAIPPGETIRFEPGGRHLMLFGVTSLGEALPVRLEIEYGSDSNADLGVITRETRKVSFRRIEIGAQ